MADFVQIMKDWRRMCNSVPGKGESGSLCSDKESGYVCPLKYNGLCCKAIASQTDKDIISGENIILSWAEEHPEPVYPTWWKYMCMIGVIPEKLGDKTLGEMTVYSLMNTHIQTDIAKKLGLEPKEG